MNLKQLEVFIAVAESASFSRAAELTFLTQSTVSQHISALENEFGLKLLDRTGKGALLTKAGKLLLTQARRVIAEAKEIPLALDRFRGLSQVVLTVGGSNVPACYMFPECIVDVAGLKIFRHFYLASHRGRDLSPAASAFAEAILQHFQAA